MACNLIIVMEIHMTQCVFNGNMRVFQEERGCIAWVVRVIWNGNLASTDLNYCYHIVIMTVDLELSSGIASSGFCSFYGNFLFFDGILVNMYQFLVKNFAKKDSFHLKKIHRFVQINFLFWTHLSFSSALLF